MDDHILLIDEDQQRKALAKRVYRLWCLALAFILIVWLGLVTTFSGLIWTLTDSALTNGEIMVERIGSAEETIETLLESNDSSSKVFPLTCSLNDDVVVLMNVGSAGRVQVGLFQDNLGLQDMTSDASSRKKKDLTGGCMVDYLTIMKHYTDRNGLIAEILLPQGEIFDTWMWLSVMYRNSTIQYGRAVERWRIDGIPVAEVEEVGQQVSLS